MVDVDRVLDAVFGGGPGAERPITGETEKLPGIVFNANHREVVPSLYLKPPDHGFGSPMLVIVQGRGGQNRVVENLQYRG